jgi:hypothetical protein
LNSLFKVIPELASWQIPIVADLLVDFDFPVVGKLIDMLSSSDIQERAVACIVLGKLNVSRAIEPLMAGGLF